MSDKLAPVVFVPHGGGPLPLLGDPNHRVLVEFLSSLAPHLGRPSALLLISAHWEAEAATLTAAAAPSLIYDYGGFPPESYQIQYPAPGDPALASEVAALLSQAGFDPVLDTQWGFDHGMFVPLKLIYPQANIPCVQLSLIRGLNPQQHLALGTALQPLRARNVLIIGSGFSFHNLRAMLSGQLNGQQVDNLAFEQWLFETCCGMEFSAQDRVQRLAQWAQAPGARFCHPREEHLLPLHVCAAAAGFSQAERLFYDQLFGAWSSGYLWQ